MSQAQQIEKRTAKTEILKKLRIVKCYLAVHEMNIYGYSENCVATRLPELAKEGKVIGRYRKGFNYKEWGLEGTLI